MLNSSRTPFTFTRLLRRVRFEEALAAAAFATLLLTLSAQALFAQNSPTIAIDQPWARATPQGATVGAGYMVLRNEGAATDRLVAATADVAPRVEIHEMAMANGVMTMRQVPGGLLVPANGSVTLKPGSYHLMFMDLTQPLKQGTIVTGTLTFEKAGTIPVKLTVEPIGAEGVAAGEGHSHAHGK
ncbi:copper chaperone PCu(A)C [Aquabacter spiritensis]|uniref:Copper(I)-binding protein n=1 Tax=Aquabacter spiritensis TaxID=933073 RepID=A0A4R3M944_9HYPH|nr:copper chaperone PCu(A)C [Aquabacter spiritensis]TCT07895.1 hypothetical protein EDC64_101414 [Aquabacter spiritensis]